MVTRTTTSRPESRPLLAGYLLLLTLFWLYTGFTTTQLTNWLAESVLFLSVIILLTAFYRYFRFSVVSYSCFFVYLLLHLYATQHSYPQAPAGFWLQEVLGLDRNPYDRLVHFAFGLLMVKPMTELAAGPLQLRPSMRWWWPLELTLALSVLYELVEYVVAGVLVPSLGTSYLGYQGDIWDAHKDVLAALIGAAIALLLLYTKNRFRK